MGLNHPQALVRAGAPQPTAWANYLVGPFYDFKRFVVGSLSPPPPTRVVSETGLAGARARLTWANCHLNRCTVENLHTWTSPLPADRLFDLLMNWQLWPRSSFFACPTTDRNGTVRFAYRWYGLVPIVMMRLKTAIKPRCIIYDIVWGIGQGGYHSFLLDEAASGQTDVSIFTTFSPTPLFFEGIHDQMNFDIFKQLQERGD
ncbi:MAG: hypothetical protein KDI79_27675 [Anaerolineae bacterium]|nr:hypothetical protein [Anaerolineae bacterium]